MGKTVFSDTPPQGTIVTAAFLNAVNNQRHDGKDIDGHGVLDYAVATGSGGAYAIALSPALTEHIPGMPISVKANHENPGAATVAINALPAVAIKRRDGSNLLAGDIVNGAIVTLVYNGTVYQLTSQDKGIDASPTFPMIENLSISATVASNALTVAVKGNDGNNPSETNKVRIAFRKSTLTDGKYDIISLTSALSLVLSAGSSLGFEANEFGRIYVWAVNNAGTIKLGLSRSADIYPETDLQTTVAEGGAGGADSASTLYSDAVYTSKAVRCIGYIEITTGATAGNWSSDPSKVQLMGPDIVQTGNVVGSFRNLKASATGTNADVSVTADELVVENYTGKDYLTLRNVSLTINSAGSGANGLDTGTLAASSWYSIWVIYNPMTKMTAGLLSLSSTAPTLPSGYTYKARAGWVRTDATANKYPLGFTQVGRRVQYKVASGSNLTGLPIMASGTAGSTSTPTWVSIGVGNFIPTTANAVDLVLCHGSSEANKQAMVAPSNQYGAYLSTSNPPPLAYTTGTTGASNSSSRLITLEGTNIYWANSFTNGRVQCAGWEDNI